MLKDLNSYAYISTGTTTQVLTGPGVLVGIMVNTTAAGTIKVIDGTAGVTANIATLKASIGEGWYGFGANGIAISAGIRIVTAAASDITVVYRT